MANGNGEWEWRIENAQESELADKAQSALFFIAINARRSRAGRQKVLKKSGKTCLKRVSWVQIIAAGRAVV
jgi:hypothetical protein